MWEWRDIDRERENGENDMMHELTNKEGLQKRTAVEVEHRGNIVG